MKFILSLLLVLAAVSHSYAQDEGKMPHPITNSGSAAWMFTLSGLGAFGMDGFDIADIQPSSTTGSMTTGAVSPASSSTQNPISTVVFGAGGKYYISDGMAIRALLGFSTNSEGDADKLPGKTTITKYGIAAGIELHTHDVYSTSPYFGAQISFAGLSGKNEFTNAGITSETSGSGTALGIGIVAGFDWYFTDGIALGGEYMLGFSTTSTSSTSGGTTTDDPSQTHIGIGSASVHLVVHM